MSKYSNGRDFEWKVRDHLTENGYEVIRSAGSKTKVDLVALKRGQILFVQCKRDGRIGPMERGELRRLAQLVGAVPVVGSREMVGRRYEVLLRTLVGPGPKDYTQFIVDEIGAQRANQTAARAIAVGMP